MLDAMDAGWLMGVVRKHELMSTTRVRKTLIAGAIAIGLLALLIGPLAIFEVRWRGLKDRMTEAQVSQALGPPSSVGTSGVIGAGGKAITRWYYIRNFLGHSVYYCVDFDYIGVGGAPVVFRTER